MNCDRVRTLSFDALDELLDADEARAFDAHLATCAACRSSHEAAARRHARILAPYPVAAPSRDLPARITRQHQLRTRRVPRWAGYAASFAAGVLVTILLRAPSLPATPPEPVSQPVAAQPADTSPDSTPESPAPHLRRIR